MEDRTNTKMNKKAYKAKLNFQKRITTRYKRKLNCKRKIKKFIDKYQGRLIR